MKLSDAQIKHMVDRFLGWPLPDNFNPDGGVSFERFGNAWDAAPISARPERHQSAGCIAGRRHGCGT